MEDEAGMVQQDDTQLGVRPDATDENEDGMVVFA